MGGCYALVAWLRKGMLVLKRVGITAHVSLHASSSLCVGNGRVQFANHSRHNLLPHLLLTLSTRMLAAGAGEGAWGDICRG